MSADRLTLSEVVNDHLTEIELEAMIDAASRCECDFDCYCAKNLDWAERRLAQIRQKYAESASGDRDV